MAYGNCTRGGGRPPPETSGDMISLSWCRRTSEQSRKLIIFWIMARNPRFICEQPRLLISMGIIMVTNSEHQYHCDMPQPSYGAASSPNLKAGNAHVRSPGGSPSRQSMGSLEETSIGSPVEQKYEVSFEGKHRVMWDYIKLSE